MQEGTIMELVKWFIGLMIVMMIVSLSIFLLELSNINTFKQQVNYQIERQGGLTETAITKINEYSNKYYNGIFTLKSNQLNEKVDYGEIVDYVIVGKFDIKIFPIPDITLEFSGTGVSQVR